MNKKVRVSLPANITHDDLEIFESFSSYKFPYPKVKYLKNVFITSTGLVCGNKGLIKECCHYDWVGQPHICFKEALKFVHDAQENSQNLLVFDNDEIYLLIHHPWHTNYYHWLNETIYRLWIIKDKVDQMVLLLPAKDQVSKIAMDSLKLFNFKNIIHIPNGKSALVRTLCMPAQKPNIESYNPTALKELNKIYVGYVSDKNAHTEVNERIYLSRKNSLRRRIINEDDVIKTISKYNFIVVYSEDYTFFEQVSLFSKAKFLVGNHGAGLTNMLFMAQGSTVF